MTGTDNPVSLWGDFWKTVQSDLFGIGPRYNPSYFQHPDFVGQLPFNFVDPRLSRVRSVQQTGPNRDELTHQARNGVTHEITSTSSAYQNTYRPGLDFIEDTIVNKDYYQVFVDPPVDNGGILSLVKSRFLSSPAALSTDWHFNQRHFGNVAVILPPSDDDGFSIWDWTSLPSFDENELVGLGTKAWSIAKPAQTSAGLANFAADARDLPDLLHLKLRGLKSIGDFVLLEQFGWENLL
jgi:hypothetical protein